MSDIKKDIGERLKYARERKNLKQNKVAKQIGIHNSTLAKYESGEREADNETIIKLARLYNVTHDWLLTGVDNIKKPLPIDYGLVPVDFGRMVKLPILGTIRAGEPIDMIQNIEGYELVEQELLRGREGFVLKVTGNSMSGDYIFDGYKVVVVLQDEVSPIDISVVAINGNEATLKRVKCQGEMCVLSSSNPQHEPLIYPSDQVHVIGKVVRFWKDV